MVNGLALDSSDHVSWMAPVTSYHGSLKYLLNLKLWTDEILSSNGYSFHQSAVFVCPALRFHPTIIGVLDRLHHAIRFCTLVNVACM